MASRQAAFAAATILVFATLIGPLSTRAAAAIDCSVAAYTFAVIETSTTVRMFGHADARCNAPTWVEVGVQVVISTDGVPTGKPIATQNFNSCLGSQCGVDAPPTPSPGLGPYSNGTWAHARGAVSWDDGTGTIRSKPFTLGTWNCTQHPYNGMAPSVFWVRGRIVAMVVHADGGTNLRSCTSQTTRA